jgi:hypothetical protein
MAFPVMQGCVLECLLYKYYQCEHFQIYVLWVNAEVSDEHAASILWVNPEKKGIVFFHGIRAHLQGCAA